VQKLWNTLPIRSKLLAAFSVLLALSLIALAVDYVFVTRQTATIEESMERTWPMVQAFGNVRRETTYLSVQAFGYLMADPKKDGVRYRTTFDEHEAILRREVQKLAEYASPKERQQVASFAAWLPSFSRAKHRSFELKLRGNTRAALAAQSSVKSSEGDAMLVKLGDAITRRYQRESAQAVAGGRAAQTVTLVAAVVTLVLGCTLALLLGGAIARRLRQVTGSIEEVIGRDVGALVESMKRLAAGDLTAKVELHGRPLSVEGSDEPATLAKAYNALVLGIEQVGREFSTTTELLSGTVMQIKGAVEQVATAAGEIAEGSANLSQRTEEQASGLEETAASMEEFTATVKQNAHNAEEANALGTGAQEQARKSGEVMHDVVATMEKINASSQKIVEIISVIDGIAFQTNILALNAAVEAARAGEQGRGFAVVAGEVRSLAQRSAAAAKEIKSLIDDTVSKVSDGSALVKQAGSTMGELVDSVQRVTAILSDIAAASREQSSGIDQVNKAITQMDEVTQQNAALVEEAAAAAGSLEEQARALREAVNAFKLAVSAADPPVTTRETGAKAPGGSDRSSAGAVRHGNGKSAVAIAEKDDEWETF
jgi:methyl-accepting chemotaxis protein